MIQMKSGAYGGKKMIRPEDGPFSLPPDEEVRLVRRGVAKYVNGSGEPAVEGKSFDNMNMAELRAIGKEMGLTFRVGMTKAAMIEALTAQMEQGEPVDEDGEYPDGIDDADDVVDAPDEDAPTFDPAEAVQ